MTQQLQVVEDGLESPSPTGRSVPGWLFLLLGFVIGLALGSAFLTSGASLPPTDGNDAIADPIEEIVKVPESAGLSEIINGFDHTLVAVSADTGDVADILTWPADGPVLANRMRSGLFLSVDSSSQYYALMSKVPDQPGAILSTGRYHTVTPQVSEVTSYAWHDSVAGLLAFTTIENGEWQLWKLLPNSNTELVTAGEERASSLVGWGDWGFAIQDSTGRIVLLTARGEMKDEHPGIAFSTADGWIAARDQSFILLSAGGGVQRVSVESESGPVIDAAISPDGTHVAVVTGQGLVVVSRNDSSTIARYEGPVGGRPAWSDDGRYVAVPRNRGVLILDVAESDEYRVLSDRSVVFVHLR